MLRSKKTTHKSNKSQKQGCILFITLIFIIMFKYLFNFLLELFTLREYSPYYFACVKSPLVNTIIYPFLFVAFFAVGFYILPNRKMSSKKYICCASVFLLVTLITTIIFSGNVWIFNKDTISYNTLFQKNKIVYSYDDIEIAEMTIELEATRFTTTRLVYILEMNDSKQIKFDAFDSFRKDDKLLIAFDNAISDKRKVKGNFEYFDNATDEFNKYFSSLYKTENSLQSQK